ncbi:oxygenase MpaB family protein [Nannocystis punicea]|uniref:Oxygenase MpaB family protein n=1 Tax=Nannocystis punicea TaxID=2995304 RepID=A0ABY7H843_9BACT|nr:oxygenase MpaB family protein [Nannocystis poenicansa]WAS95328.1 oxygenase MpaB family protein [Nannocystis poenicansa]
MLDLLDLLTHHRRAPQLDGARDHLAVMRRAFFRDFAPEIRLGAALALFRVFAIPRLSALLARTGGWTHAPTSRLERTVDLLSTLIEDGPDGPRAAATLARMHAAHARHAIANDDMRYVLTTFVTEPARVIDRFGRRPLRPDEREAACLFWREVGRRVGIRDIPGSFAGMVEAARDYEARHRHAADSNRLVAEGALAAMLQVLPPPLADLGRSAVAALLEPPVRRACGLPPAPRPLAWALAGVGAARRGLGALARA